jgi:hypothetical protein
MNKKYIQILAIITTIALIITCFLPWVHYNSINETFTGLNVKKFSTGVNYGKPGKIIIGLCVISLFCVLVPKLFLKRINMFATALLFAYCIRTYVLFTGAIFEGQVEKLAGIYLILLFSLTMVVCSIFPNLKEE